MSVLALLTKLGSTPTLLHNLTKHHASLYEIVFIDDKPVQVVVKFKCRDEDPTMMLLTHKQIKQIEQTIATFT